MELHFGLAVDYSVWITHNWRDQPKGMAQTVSLLFISLQLVNRPLPLVLFCFILSLILNKRFSCIKDGNFLSDLLFSIIIQLLTRYVSIFHAVLIFIFF